MVLLCWLAQPLAVFYKAYKDFSDMNTDAGAFRYHLALAYLTHTQLQRRVMDTIVRLDAEEKPALALPIPPKGQIFAANAEHWEKNIDKGSPKTIGVYTGAFHPLTNAHLAVVSAALQTGLMETALLSMSRTTLHKRQLQSQEQTLHVLLLAATAQRDARLDVALFNCGLYKEQAKAVRAAFPQVETVYLIVGFDKALQILDPAYYADRDAELNELFSLAHLLVCPRFGFGKADLDNLFCRPENAAWKTKAQYISLGEEYAYVSSTKARAMAEQNLDITEYVPPEQRAMWDYQPRFA